MGEEREIGFPKKVLGSVADHAEAAYPHECFGFLLGRFGEGGIQAVLPAKNANTSRPHDRYEMDPLEFLQAQTEAEGWGGEVVGFYHSHPDHPSAPSEYDRKMAWEGYLYLILSVRGGKFHDARAWIYDSDIEHFKEIPFKPHAFPFSSLSA